MDDLTFESWLQTQSEERQVEVLGKGKQELWKAGKLTTTQLIDQSGNPKTLAQLRSARNATKVTR